MLTDKFKGCVVSKGKYMNACWKYWNAFFCRFCLKKRQISTHVVKFVPKQLVTISRKSRGSFRPSCPFRDWSTIIAQGSKPAFLTSCLRSFAHACNPRCISFFLLHVFSTVVQVSNSRNVFPWHFWRFQTLCCRIFPISSLPVSLKPINVYCISEHSMLYISCDTSSLLSKSFFSEYAFRNNYHGKRVFVSHELICNPPCTTSAPLRSFFKLEDFWVGVLWNRSPGGGRGGGCKNSENRDFRWALICVKTKWGGDGFRRKSREVLFWSSG